MRNHQGKLAWERVTPFLFAILLYIALPAIPCHAQGAPCFTFGPDALQYGLHHLSMTPGAWTAGQSYFVTMVESDPNEVTFNNLDICGAYVGPGNYSPPSVTTPDPNISVTNATYVSSSTITFDVSLSPNVNTTNEWFSLADYGYWIFAKGFILLTATNLGPCKNGQCPNVADPINVTNGNVWVQEHDYNVPGLGGGLVLQRTWNSLSTTVGAPLGTFGTAWFSTYDEVITGPDANNNLTYWRADGSSWTFTYNPTLSTYTLTSPTNVRAQMTYTTNVGFTVTFADNSKRTFNLDNYLSSIVDRNNNQTTVHLDSYDRVTSVTSPGGVTLTFTYGTSGSFYQAVKVADSVGTVANYTYNSSGYLTQVSYSDGSQYNFTYDPTSLMLLSVTDAQGKLIEAHTYDSQNRGLTSTRAYGVDSVSLQY